MSLHCGLELRLDQRKQVTVNVIVEHLINVTLVGPEDRARIYIPY